MSIEAGSEDNIPEVSGEPHISCGACASLITSKTQYHRTNCGHSFHKSCLAKCEKSRPFCPVCNARLLSEPPTPSTSGMVTRRQAKITSDQT